MKKNILFIAIIVLMLAGGALVVYRNQNATSDPSPTPSSSDAPLPTPSAIDITKLTKNATCTLSGSIEFKQKNLFVSNGAAIAYTGIDSDGRLITWTISPNDDLSVGPNLFANLQIPDGKDSITLRLPENPVSRRYVLTAKVGYGRWINNAVVMKNAPCTGSIPVILSY